jgi:hypothetical protein
MAGCLVAKAKVAGSNPVFRSNYTGPALLRIFKRAGLFILGLEERLDPIWTWSE